MAYTHRKYSNQEVDEAGRIIINPAASENQMERAKNIIDNWRASHAFPLLSFRMLLKRRVKIINENGLIAQRTKRFRAIKAKLERFLQSEKHSKLGLSSMQDIGGCRAILPSISEVEKIVEMYKKGRSTNRLENENDYITTPKYTTGYRSHHLIYRYKSRTQPEYDGLQIELQIRSQLQHIWATAVEAVDTFRHQELKSNRGNPDWQMFFKLMGSYTAWIEHKNIVPGTPSDFKTLITEIQRYAAKIDVGNELHTIQIYAQALRKERERLPKNAHIFILKLDTQGTAPSLTISAFKRKEEKLAEKELSKLEKQSEHNESIDVVRVFVEEIGLLEAAYPNYFLDIGEFIKFVDQAVKQRT